MSRSRLEDQSKEHFQQKEFEVQEPWGRNKLDSSQNSRKANEISPQWGQVQGGKVGV